mgnify:CR=1 FL=1
MSDREQDSGGGSTPDPESAGPHPPATERVLAGYCHDLNGQLTNAFGWLSLMGPTVSAGDGPAEHLRGSLERMEALLRELRWLIRDPAPTSDPTSLADLLEGWEAALRQHPRFHGVTVERLAPRDLPAVSIDFASALRVLLLAADAAAGGTTVDSMTLRIDSEEGGVNLTFFSATDPQVASPVDPTTTGRVGSRASLLVEAREAGFGVAWIDDAVRITVPSIG